jgi:hypothetical protein
MKLFFSFVAVMSALLVAGCAKSSHPRVEAPQTLEETATAVRLQVTIYELRVLPAKIGELDAAKLATSDFSKPLPDFGEAKPLYRVDQKVSLSGDRVMMGKEEPMVTNTRTNDRGQRISAFQMANVGAIIEFKADRRGPSSLQVTSSIEMSAKSDSTTKASEGFTPATIRRVTMSLKGPVTLNEPSVLISADATSLDENQKAIVHVARLVVGGV